MRFEIVYADNSIVEGATAAQFRAAPMVGVQFLIERKADGRVIVHKALDEYRYLGETKRGAWTNTPNYERIKSTLPFISDLI